MMKRAAWALASVLAVVLVIECLIFGARSRDILPRYAGEISLLPRDQWGFGRVKLTIGVCDLGACGPADIGESLKLGFFSVRLY